jgi:hypothetical protein
VSATSVSAQLGSRLGFTTYLLDMLKILVPALVLKQTRSDDLFLGLRGRRHARSRVSGLLRFPRRPPGYRRPMPGCWPSIGSVSSSVHWGGCWWAWWLSGTCGRPTAPGSGPIIPWLWFTTHNPVFLAYALFVNAVFMIGMIPETRQWFKIRRENKWNDTTEVMQLSGMGGAC